MRAQTLALATIALLGCLDIVESVPLPDAGRTGLCGVPAEYQAQPFPPAGAEVEIIAVEVADVNGDGQQDMVFLNAPDAPQSAQGFYVLLGPADEDNLAYHAYVPTQSEPFAIEVFQFTGDGCLDVSVFGTSREATPAGTIEIWENVGPRPMFGPTPAMVKEVELTPMIGEPSFMAVGALHGDLEANDLSIASGTNVAVLPIATDTLVIDGLAGADTQFVAQDGSDTPGDWTAIRGVRFERSVPDDFQDLLIIERENVAWILNDGNAGFSLLETEITGGTFELDTFAATEINDNESPDLIGGSGSAIGAYTVGRDDSAANIGNRDWAGVGIAGVAALESIAAGDLDGGSEPEIIVLDFNPGASTAHVVPDANQDGNQLLPGIENPFTFTGIDPAHAVIFDFDGDQVDELWVVDPNRGTIECLRVASQMLELCRP